MEKINYICRIDSGTYHIEADTPEQAANDCHFKNRYAGVLFNGCVYAIVDVDGYGKFLSRVFTKGIGRKGGMIKNQPKDVAELAKKLGIDEDLLKEDGWLFESNDWER